MLLLNRREVEGLLDPARLPDALAPAMAELSAGGASVPPRGVARAPRGLLGVMPACAPAADFLGAKLVTVFPDNHGAGLPSHQAVIVAFDPADGRPLALLDGTWITAVRTAAGSALATRLLARPDAAVLAIVGTGVQARAHALAIAGMRALREIRIVGRDPDKAARLAREVAVHTGVPARALASFGDAAAGAGIVCAATHAVAPVVAGRLLEPGTHVNSVGLNPYGRELDDEAVRRAVLFVESRAAALDPGGSGANDLLEPIRAGIIAATDIRAEVGEVVAGSRDGRRSAAEITLYKSVGVAVQDAVAARLVLQAARERGAGTEIAL